MFDHRTERQGRNKSQRPHKNNCASSSMINRAGAAATCLDDGRVFLVASEPAIARTGKMKQ